MATRVGQAWEVSHNIIISSNTKNDNVDFEKLEVLSGVLKVES